MNCPLRKSSITPEIIEKEVLIRINFETVIIGKIIPNMNNNVARINNQNNIVATFSGMIGELYLFECEIIDTNYLNFASQF